MRDPVKHERGTIWESVTAPPDVALSGVVHEYAEFREQSQHPVARTEAAGCAPVLIIELNDPLLVTDVADHGSPRTWQAFGAGVSQAPTSTLHAGAQHCVEVRLTPLGLYRMSGLAMDELCNRVVGLEDLFGRDGRDLPERLAAERDWAQRFKLLDSVFACAAADGPEPDPEISFAWDRLNRAGGTTTISDILNEIGWSRARLAKRFRGQVGLTPKAAARVLRFERALELLAQPGHRSLASIAVACGYYDQAHFNRDFREHSGCSPTEWVTAQYEDLPGARVPTDR
jgi:AraC-like DNA-binding protein